MQMTKVSGRCKGLREMMTERTILTTLGQQPDQLHGSTGNPDKEQVGSKRMAEDDNGNRGKATATRDRASRKFLRSGEAAFRS